ncbi:hypothetical protein [Clostridium baratii]|uniref:hypothetical protein n=1 Tax=Clostridium baratii TaxID=1561 RepID=UPI002A75BF7A|nr:hypothetical protein [Clostridium baratii]MDY3206705.1 hypothetical protein [Clostridium baratii]
MFKEELYIKEREYSNAIKQDVIQKSSVYFDDLGLVQCKLENGRKIKGPIFMKVSIYTVFKFYINLGIVFRDKKNKFYTMEEVEQLLVKYYKEHNIDYEII